MRAHIRNQQAHKELQSFNDTKTFLHIHPLTIRHHLKQTQVQSLRDMQKNEPIEFLNEITNTVQNIRRIESDLRRSKYKDEEQRQSWEDNLTRANIKYEVLLELIK